MPAQTATKATTMVGTDGWALEAHVKRLSETTRSIIPIDTQAEEDGLPALFPGGVLPVPSFICRTDQNYLIKTWNGTKWMSSPHVEFSYSTAAGAVPNNTVWGPGALTLDTGAVTTDSSIAAISGGADKINIAQPGEYAVWFGGAFSAGVSGNSWFQIKDSTDTIVHASGPAVEFWGHASIPNFRVTAANTVLWFRLKQVSGAAASSAGRIRITRVG